MHRKGHGLGWSCSGQSVSLINAECKQALNHQINIITHTHITVIWLTVCGWGQVCSISSIVFDGSLLQEDFGIPSCDSASDLRTGMTEEKLLPSRPNSTEPFDFPSIYLPHATEMLVLNTEAIGKPFPSPPSPSRETANIILSCQLKGRTFGCCHDDHSAAGLLLPRQAH